MNHTFVLIIILFITYFIIIAILCYYFINHRTIWDKLFPIPNIIKNIINFIECAIHCVMTVHNVIITDQKYCESCESCKSYILCDEDKNMCSSDIYQLELLKYIYNNLADSNISSKIQHLKYILQYIIQNYEDVKIAKTELFENINNMMIENQENKNDNNNYLEIENIYILEEHIKSWQNIFIKLNNINIDMISSSFILNFINLLQQTIIAECIKAFESL